MSGVRGEVPVRINDRDVSLAPTYRALEAIEMRLGIGLFELHNRLVRRDVRVRDLAVIVYEGLRGAGHTGPNGGGEFMSMDQVGEWCLANMSDACDCTGLFLLNAFGGAKSEKKSEGRPPAS